MRPRFGYPPPALLIREREKEFVSHAGHIARIRVEVGRDERVLLPIVQFGKALAIQRVKR
jgi:hypothetical protein